jgi:hypothetical protein
MLQAHASATIKMSTPVLTRLLHEAAEHQQPPRDGRFRPKMRYAHQGGMNPPLVVIHGNSLDHVNRATSATSKGACASTSSSSARRCASRCARPPTPSTTRADGGDQRALLHAALVPEAGPL